MEKLRTTILIPAEWTGQVVDQWREKYDPSAKRGIPPHITLLFPFAESEIVSPEIINKLKELFNGFHPITFSLSKINTFPGVVYLEPDPREPFIEMTKKIFQAFPKYPPFEGKYPNINPHLTLGHELPEGITEKEVLTDLQNEVESRLPLVGEANEAWLMKQNNDKNWTLVEKFKLGN